MDLVTVEESSPRKYHHGNLKAALLEAAVEVIRLEGLDKLSLRKLAKTIGVSQTAPYSHFKDKKALVTAVAAYGYNRMIDNMRGEIKDHADQRERLQAVGRGYVLFAVHEPELFRLMMTNDWSLETEDQDIVKARLTLLEMLDHEVRKYLDSIQSSQDATLIGTTAWSAAHGLAMLLIDKKIPMPDSDNGLRILADHVGGSFTQNTI